ncbi:MAG: PorP/SprF family type IX secretion system membrane protein [Bacteroidia bacterium]
MKTRRITLIFVGLSTFSIGLAQQTALVNHYNINRFLINPANAGTNGNSLFILNRNQWVDVEGAPETFIGTFDGSVGSTNIAYGVTVMNDIVNIVGKTGVFGTYAYKLPIKESMSLRFGLSVGFEQNKLLFDRVNAQNPLEVTLINNIEQQSNFDANSGIAFNAKNLNLGIAAYQLFANQDMFSDELRHADYSFSFVKHYTGSASYKFFLEENKLSLDPTVVVRFAKQVNPQMDYNLLLNWKDMAWIGGGYRTGYGANFMAGGVFGSRLLGSYSYGRSIGPIQRLSVNSHEIMLGYKFNGIVSRDGDKDGVSDELDKEPNTPEGCPVNIYGIALDDDIDGVPNCKDLELDTRFGAPVDENGIALDGDKDGVIDLLDHELNTPEGCPVDKLGVSTDTDHDGVPDCRDKQINSPFGAKVDADGVALDSDNDGVYDIYDLEPLTPHQKHINSAEPVDASQCIVDEHGIAKDTDLDGVPDCIDLEMNTPKGAMVDAYGRALDTDGDGYPDGIDHEINSPKGAKVDNYGVALPSPNMLDDDGDGIPNAIDLEPNTPKGTPVDDQGRALINPAMVNRLDIKDMDDNSTEWDYYMVVGVFQFESNLKGYRAKLETKYGVKTQVLQTEAGYYYVWTKIVVTKEQAYAENDRLLATNLSEYIVGNPWLWKEPKKK